ncbi:MAG: hypothetical protein WB791_08635 [Waddliaceae bacterium]
MDTPDAAYDVTIIGATAFVADGSSGLQVIDAITSPPKPDGYYCTIYFPEAVIPILCL